MLMNEFQNIKFDNEITSFNKLNIKINDSDAIDFKTRPQKLGTNTQYKSICLGS